MKLTKIKHKERILKAAKEKQQVTYKGNPIHLTTDLSAETLQARREWQDIFKVLKDQLLNVWGFPCILLVAFPLMLLIFFLCVESLLV